MKKFAVLFSLALLAAPLLAAEESISLFDGKTMAGWAEVDFIGKGTTRIKPDGVIEMGIGSMLTGVVCTNPPLRMNYELTLEARRTMGSDFFCGLTFPVSSNSSSLILGGWGGNLTGISSMDGMDASENETTGNFEFEKDTWYSVKLKVTPDRIEAWLGEKRIVNVDISERRMGMRPGDIEMCMPLGIATYQTCGEVRNIRMKKLP